MLLEAVVIGGIASVLGLGAGIGVGVGLLALFGAFGGGLPSATLGVEPRTVIARFAVGMVVTVVAALLPALRAAQGPAGRGDAGRGDPGPAADQADHRRRGRSPSAGAVALTLGLTGSGLAVLWLGGVLALHRRGAAHAAGEPAGTGTAGPAVLLVGCPAGWAG